MHEEEDEKSKKNRLRKKLPPPVLLPLCTLACHAALGRQAFELGQWVYAARLLHTFLRRAQCCPVEVQIPNDPPLILDEETNEERCMTEEEMAAEGIVVGTVSELQIPAPSCMANETVGVKLSELNEWVAEVRLLDGKNKD